MSSIRETFLPDDGCVFIRCDMSQIESRMCYMYCGTERLIDLANRTPDTYDAHTDNASMIFGKPHNAISKDERYLGKKTTHGAQRGLQGNKLSESILKDTEGKLFLHPRKCDSLLEGYHNAIWEVRQIFFPWVEQRVRDERVLVNSWGRRLDLRYRRIDADLYREAYSYYMQCCDEETEVLTPEGFVSFPQLHEGQKIAVYIDEEIFFEVPSKINRQRYVGKMVSFEGTRTSQLVTPNHRVLYVTNDIPKITEAEILLTYKRPQFITSGICLDGEIDFNSAEIALIAAIQADGSIHGNALTWHFSKARKVARLSWALETIGIKHSKTPQKDGTVCFYVHTDLVKPYTAFLDNKKYCARVLDLSYTTRLRLINELIHWDGSSVKAKSVGGFWYDSTIKQNVDWIQAAAALTGFRTSQTIASKKVGKHNAVHRVYLVPQQYSIPSKIKEVDYDGMVYCPTVSTGLFLTRRHGKICITGNSENADWTNQYLFIPTSYYMLGKYGRPCAAQVHDEVIVSVPLLGAYDAAKFMVRSAEQTRMIPSAQGGWNALKVPAEVIVGRSWGDKKGCEFKRLPGESDFYHELWKGGFFENGN